MVRNHVMVVVVKGSDNDYFLNLRNGCDDQGKGTLSNDVKLRNGCGGQGGEN